MPNRWNKISESPTRTGTGASRPGLTAEDLFRQPDLVDQVALDEKLRQAYFWLVNRAVISPFYDVEFGDDAPRDASPSATPAPSCG